MRDRMDELRWRTMKTEAEIERAADREIDKWAKRYEQAMARVHKMEVALRECQELVELLTEACKHARFWFTNGGADAFSRDEEADAYERVLLKQLQSAITKARGG